MVTADHGPAVSGAHNTIICARAGKDLVSSLTSGLLTIVSTAFLGGERQGRDAGLRRPGPWLQRGPRRGRGAARGSPDGSAKLKAMPTAQGSVGLLLLQGDRFGGALDAAAKMFSKAFDSGIIPMEFVNKMKKEGKLIMGIGHRVKSVRRRFPQGTGSTGEGDQRARIGVGTPRRSTPSMQSSADRCQR